MYVIDEGQWLQTICSVVLSLGGTVEMCMFSLCAIFGECSNCFAGHLAYTRILPTPCCGTLDVMSLICVA